MSNQEAKKADYSVLMSVYEKENPAYLRESIESILHQTAPPAEFVIVCDGVLPCALKQVLEEYQEKYSSVIRLFPLAENQGLGKALNYGLKKCRYEYVARMDSDDISFPERCEKELGEMMKQKLDLIGAAVAEFEESPEHVINLRMTPKTQEEILAFSRRRNPFNHPAVMFRKTTVLQAGGYQPFPYFEDYDLWVRMLQNGARCSNIQEPLLYMRGGGEMLKRRGSAAYVKCLWNFKRELLRRGYLTLLQFLWSALPHVAVSLMPNSLRKVVYGKLLRKEVSP